LALIGFVLGLNWVCFFGLVQIRVTNGVDVDI
jgi:hypothetical protein